MVDQQQSIGYSFHKYEIQQIAANSTNAGRMLEAIEGSVATTGRTGTSYILKSEELNRINYFEECVM